MSVSEVILTYGAPLGLTLKRHREGLAPALVQELKRFQALAEAEGVIDRDAVHVEGDEIAFTLTAGGERIVAAATCYGTATGDLFLQFIYVIPPRRRQGCASCLWAAVAALARATQSANVTAISKPDNVAMAAVYAKFGAPVVGHVHRLNVSNPEGGQP